jgi:hypothetical protein
MNKKQLIVGWVMGIVASVILFFRLGKRVAPALYLLTDERPYWMPTTRSILIVILIIGGFLIYTLRDKKK